MTMIPIDGFDWFRAANSIKGYDETMDDPCERRYEPTQNEQPMRVGHILSEWEYN